MPSVNGCDLHDVAQGAFRALQGRVLRRERSLLAGTEAPDGGESPAAPKPWWRSVLHTGAVAAGAGGMGVLAIMAFRRIGGA